MINQKFNLIFFLIFTIQFNIEAVRAKFRQITDLDWITKWAKLKRTIHAHGRRLAMRRRVAAKEAARLAAVGAEATTVIATTG